jgi:hypothetical protein
LGVGAGVRAVAKVVALATGCAKPTQDMPQTAIFAAHRLP